MKSRRGSAYLFAAIIVMSVSIMLAVSINVTRYGAALTYSVVKNDDLYYLAADAAEQLTAELNALLHSRLGDIEERVNRMFDKENITDYVSYNPESNLFYLKQKDPSRTKAGKRNTLYSSYFIKAAEELLYSDIEKMIRNGRAWETDGRAISAEFWREDGSINIEITARDPLTGASKSVLVKVALAAGEHEEIIFEQYKFRDRPEYLEARQGGITLSAGGFTAEAELPEVFLNRGSWSEENPVAFIADGGTVDVDLFRGIPSILIMEGDAQISGEAYEFLGLLYAAGDVIISGNVNIRGAVAARAVIPQDSEEPESGMPENFSIVYEDNFFEVKISDRKLRGQVYDYLGLTNFGGRTGGFIDQTEKLKSDVLRFLELSPDFGLAISAVPEFTILTLQ